MRDNNISNTTNPSTSTGLPMPVSLSLTIPGDGGTGGWGHRIRRGRDIACITAAWRGMLPFRLTRDGSVSAQPLPAAVLDAYKPYVCVTRIAGVRCQWEGLTKLDALSLLRPKKASHEKRFANLEGAREKPKDPLFAPYVDGSKSSEPVVVPKGEAVVQQTRRVSWAEGQGQAVEARLELGCVMRDAACRTGSDRYGGANGEGSVGGAAERGGNFPNKVSKPSWGDGGSLSVAEAVGTQGSGEHLLGYQRYLLDDGIPATWAPRRRGVALKTLLSRSRSQAPWDTRPQMTGTAGHGAASRSTPPQIRMGKLRRGFPQIAEVPEGSDDEQTVKGRRYVTERRPHDAKLAGCVAVASSRCLAKYAYSDVMDGWGIPKGRDDTKKSAKSVMNPNNLEQQQPPPPPTPPCGKAHKHTRPPLHLSPAGLATPRNSSTSRHSSQLAQRHAGRVQAPVGGWAIGERQQPSGCDNRG
ncbi:hypothetical protein G7046_g8107 [Stylonectria norvegica]|nr:hypothetical protein G7046_g8107 [Stylonectria norvegica]